MGAQNDCDFDCDAKRLMEKSLWRVNNIEVNKFAAKQGRATQRDVKNENSNENGDGKQKSITVVVVEGNCRQYLGRGIAAKDTLYY